MLSSQELCTHSDLSEQGLAFPDSTITMNSRYLQPASARQVSQSLRAWKLPQLTRAQQFLQTARAGQFVQPLVWQPMQLARAWQLLRPAVAAASDEASADATVDAAPKCPESIDQQVTQAISAVRAARDAGVTRMQIELELPPNFATDLDDWPGGIRQQYQVLNPLLKKILKGVTDQASFSDEECLDDGDAVYVLRSSRGADDAAVSFPTAEVLGELKDLDKKVGAKGTLLLANPQWSTKGQVISDLGFGPWKKANEEFIAGFEPAYVLRKIRIKGEQLQILKAFPCKEWQVFVIPQDGSAAKRILTSAEQPEYWQMDELLTKSDWSIASKDPFTRAKSEAEFIQKSAQQPPDRNK